MSQRTQLMESPQAHCQYFTNLYLTHILLISLTVESIKKVFARLRLGSDWKCWAWYTKTTKQRIICLLVAPSQIEQKIYFGKNNWTP